MPVNGLVAFRLKYLINPSSSETTSSFQFETYDSTYLIETITSGITVAATTGVVTTNSISYSDYRVLEYDSVSFDFTLQSAMASGS